MALRQSGPSLSMLQESAIAPARLTRPNVGRSPVSPQRVEGDTMEPRVSLPIPKEMQPAAVAEAGPAEEPLEPCFRFHGFFVTPPYHISPIARAPKVSLTISTAPASSNTFLKASRPAIWKAMSLESTGCSLPSKTTA